MTMGLLEGLSFDANLEKTRAAFYRAYAMSFMLWTPVQTINLNFMPTSMQPSVVAAVNVGWQATLSILNHYHEHARAGAEGGKELRHRASGTEAELVKLRAEVIALQRHNTSLKGQVEQQTARGS